MKKREPLIRHVGVGRRANFVGVVSSARLGGSAGEVSCRGFGGVPNSNSLESPFAKGGLRGLRGLMHDIEAMLEGFALTCLAQGVLDSRFRGNDTMKRCSRMLPGV